MAHKVKFNFINCFARSTPLYSSAASDVYKRQEHRLHDAMALRRATLGNKVPYCTNMSTAQACLMGIRSLKTKEITVTALQDI